MLVCLLKLAVDSARQMIASIATMESCLLRFGVCLPFLLLVNVISYMFTSILMHDIKYFVQKKHPTLMILRKINPCIVCSEPTSQLLES